VEVIRPTVLRSKLSKQPLANLGECFAIDDEIRRERDYYESLLKQNGIEPYDDGTAQARIFYSG
jgi:hypothetical protein